jgi:hypothetical protein
MNRIRYALVAIVAALTLGGFAGAGPARAAGTAADPSVGKLILDHLCVTKGGAVVFAPNTFARCQEARTRRGFELEALICERFLGGDFQHVQHPGSRNRTNWFCFTTAPAT